jgi:hypothetical protein
MGKLATFVLSAVVVLAVFGYLTWRLYRILVRATVDPATDDLYRALREADRLRKTGPAAADRLEAAAGDRFAAASVGQESELRARAATDSRAAAKLRLQLEAGLRGVDLARKQLQRQPAAVPDPIEAGRALDAREQAFRRDLAALEATITRLKAQGL